MVAKIAPDIPVAAVVVLLFLMVKVSSLNPPTGASGYLVGMMPSNTNLAALMIVPEVVTLAVLVRAVAPLNLIKEIVVAGLNVPRAVVAKE